MVDNSNMLIRRAVSTIHLVRQSPILTLAQCWGVRSTAIVVMSLGIAACAWLPHAPSRVIPTAPPELRVDVIEIPDTVCVGDMVTFVIRTTPGNECLGDIGYWNSKGQWAGPSFDPTVADREGICRWTWTVADDALPGTAEFKAGVRGYGTMSSIMPQVFQVQVCVQ